VQKWNWQKLENTTNLNLYHFWKRNKNQEEYYQNEYKELVKSEKRREEAKKQLIEILNNK
jgi:predicted glycosyltransferase involved in capsule biosynthesis